MRISRIRNPYTGVVPETVLPLVSETQELALQCMSRIRSTAYLHHQPVAGLAGLDVGLRWMVEGLQQRSGLDVELPVLTDLGQLPEEVETVVFRVVQEALANVLRHAPLSQVRIEVERENTRVRLQFTDIPSAGTLNLCVRESVCRGMRERVAELGGYFQVTQRRTGTEIIAEVPVSASVG